MGTISQQLISKIEGKKKKEKECPRMDKDNIKSPSQNLRVGTSKKIGERAGVD